MNSAKLRTLVLLIQDDRIVLAMKKRGFGQGYYNGFGGKLEAGETIEDAAIRECQEEGGITPRTLVKVAIHDFQFADGELDMQTHVFLCSEWIGELTETEEMAPEWFAVKDIPYSKMWQDDIFWLPAVLQGQRLLGRFIFDADNNIQLAELEPVAHLN